MDWKRVDRREPSFCIVRFSGLGGVNLPSLYQSHCVALISLELIL